MTVRCPSTGRSASSTSGLLAPAAQSSVGRAACSCLPWLAVMPRRPHRPLLLPPLAWPSLHTLAHPVIFWRCQPHPATDQSALVHPSAWASAAVASPAPGRSLPGPRPHPLRLCSRRGEVNMVNKQQPSEDADSRGPHKEMPPYYAENNDSST